MPSLIQRPQQMTERNVQSAQAIAERIAVELTFAERFAALPQAASAPDAMDLVK